MLPRESRLNLGKDFKRVASGQKIETKFAKLFIKMGENISPRVGIAASGKIFKKATQRNRARRLVSFALEKLYQCLPGNINIVALPKYGVTLVKSDEVFLDIKQVLINEKIIN